MTVEERVDQFYADTIARLGERKWPGTVYLVELVRATETDARRQALEKAVEVCTALSNSPRGNDYGSIGGAFDECADAIRDLLKEETT